MEITQSESDPKVFIVVCKTGDQVDAFLTMHTFKYNGAMYTIMNREVKNWERGHCSYLVTVM